MNSNITTAEYLTTQPSTEADDGNATSPTTYQSISSSNSFMSSPPTSQPNSSMSSSVSLATTLSTATSSPMLSLGSLSSTNSEATAGLTDVMSTVSPSSATTVIPSQESIAGNGTSSVASSTTQSVESGSTKSSESQAMTASTMFPASYNNTVPQTGSTQSSLNGSLVNSNTTPSAAPSATPTDTMSPLLTTGPSQAGQNGSSASSEGITVASETPEPYSYSTQTSQTTSSSNESRPTSFVPDSTFSISGSSPAASSALTSLPSVPNVPEATAPSSTLSDMDAFQKNLIISGSVIGFVVIVALVLVAVVCYKRRRLAHHHVSASGIENISYGVILEPAGNHYDEINLEYEPVNGSTSKLYAEIYATKSTRDSDREVEFVENDLYSGSAMQLSTFAHTHDRIARVAST